MPKTSSDRPLRLVVFDWDGTLVDSQHMIADSMVQAFRSLDLAPPAPAAVRQVVGLRLEEAVGRLAGAAAESSLTAALSAAYRTAFWNLRASERFHEPLFPGIREALARLSGRPETLLAIATGKNRRGLVHSLAHLGLADRFHSLQTADDGPGKPHPAILEQAMAESGVEPARTLVVGDTSYDMQMAANAGVRAVGVAWGYHGREALLAAGASCVIDRIEALEGLV